MRCEHCGRPIKNAEMWKLGGDREAPTSRSMQSLCWNCRTLAEQTANAEVVARKATSTPIDREADEKPWVMVA